MVSMYPEKVNTDYYNVSIDGYDLIAEEITPNEAYNRRETGRKNIIGGTQCVIRTNYMPRDYTFTTHVIIDPMHPDVYDNIFREWQSKDVEVVSKYMGGKFQAECQIKPSHEESPNYIKLEIQLIEIPDTSSLIPNDVFKAPKNVSEKETKLKIKATKKKNKEKKKQKAKEEEKKKKQKEKKEKGKGKKKKKGNNITKTKKNN